MSKRLKHKLNQNKSKLDINKDTRINIEVTSDEKVIPLGEINHVVNVGTQFNKERNNSTTYRFMFTLSPLFSNVLYNVRGNTGLGDFGNSIIPENGNGLETFSDPLFLEDPYDNDFTGDIELTYEEAVNRHLIEIDGWFGFYDPDLTKSVECKYYDLEPSRKRFDLNSNIKVNWHYLITYPHRSDNTHILVNGGLLIVNAEKVELGGIPMIGFGTSTHHGLNNGDSVILTNMPDSNMEGLFKVKRLGLDNGSLKSNYFVVNMSPTGLPIGNSFTNGRMARTVNGQKSNYYVRKFKNIEVSSTDYEIYPLAYSKTIYNDINYQLTFNNEVDIEGLTDNLGRPLSELYLTFIKTITGTNNLRAPQYFTQVKSGFDLEFLPGSLTEDVSNIRRIHDGPTPDPEYFTSQTPLESGIGTNYDEYCGDIVEYNKYELVEKKLTNVLHRFNTLDREATYNGVADGPRREGYLYNPFYLIKIRDFSLYVEQGDESTVDIPDYAEDLGDGRWLWRDVLDIGSYDGNGEILDYPFTNGSHYIHKNICFGTIRQDPFGNYDLFYNGINTESDYSPSDPIGDGLSNRFKANIDNDEC